MYKNSRFSLISFGVTENDFGLSFFFSYFPLIALGVLKRGGGRREGVRGSER